MNYQEFNRIMLDCYVSRSTSSFCNLSIDDTDLEGRISVKQIMRFDELRSSWNRLLKYKDGIPQYIGLIATQCFAASQMHRDEYNSEEAYQIRLKQILGLDEGDSLQIFFKGDNPDKPVQEEIWYDLKKFLQKNFGMQINIPPKTRFKGRFVQFPRSQALLTLEDLKHFTQFFSEEFEVKEDVSFLYFQKRLLHSLINIKLSSRAAILLDDDSKRSSCVHQVYDYYNKWEGEVYYDRHSKKTTAKSKNAEYNLQSLRILLTFESGAPGFYIINDKYDVVSDLEAEKALNYKSVTCPSDGLMFFNELEYENEFVSSRFLYADTNNYILVNSKFKPAENRFLENKSIQCISIAPHLSLYKFRFDENNKPSIFSKYFQPKNPVSLIGGLKLSRRKEYLAGYGPLINCSSSIIVLHGNTRFDYDPATAEAGLYKIRVDNFKDIEFRLIETKELLEPIQSKKLGWNLNTFKIESKFHVEGCSAFCENDNAIRTWIDLNTQRKKKRYRGTNILFKAINQVTI